MLEEFEQTVFFNHPDADGCILVFDIVAEFPGDDAAAIADELGKFVITLAADLAFVSLVFHKRSHVYVA